MKAKKSVRRILSHHQKLFFAVRNLYSLSPAFFRCRALIFAVIWLTAKYILTKIWYTPANYENMHFRACWPTMTSQSSSDCFLIFKYYSRQWLLFSDWPSNGFYNQKIMNWTLFEEEFCSKLTNHSCLPKWVMRYDPCWKLFWAHEDPFSAILIFQMFISYFKRAFTLFALGFLN